MLFPPKRHTPCNLQAAVNPHGRASFPGCALMQVQWLPVLSLPWLREHNMRPGCCGNCEGFLQPGRVSIPWPDTRCSSRFGTLTLMKPRVLAEVYTAI